MAVHLPNMWVGKASPHDPDCESLCTEGAACNCDLDVPPVTDESTTAHLSRAIDLLAQLLPLVDRHSFQWPAAQETLHAAAALLAEHGRVGIDAMRDKATKWAVERKP